MIPSSVRDILVSMTCRLLSAGFGLFARASRELPIGARLALIKPCCLGDVIMSTAAVAALRRRYPQAHITYLTGAWSLPALASNPNLDATVEWNWMTGGRIGGLRRLVALLRAGRYDAAVVLDRSPLLGLAARLAGMPVCAGLDSNGRGFSLTHRVQATPGRHEADLYLDVAAALGASPHGAALAVYPGVDERAWAAETLGDRQWVAVHPGGGANPGSTLTAKRWPAERFVQIVRRLRRHGFPVLLVSGPGEPALGVGEDGAGDVPLVDLGGRATIGQLAAALARCVLFVGNDTGPMHLAVASGIPVVAVFGPSKPGCYRPYTRRAVVVHHGEACHACRFRGGLVERCVADYRCMQLATVDEVEAACLQLVAPARSVPDGVR